MKRAVLSLITLSLGLTELSYAQDAKEYAVPIEWQKVELQRQIEDSVTRSVQTVVDRAKFHIRVEIRLASARTFGGGAEPTKGQGDKAFPLAKLGLNKDSVAYKKAITDSADNVFTRIATVTVQLTLDSSVPNSAEKQAREIVPEVVRSYVNGDPELKVKRLAFFTSPATSAGEVESARVSLQAAKTLADAILQSNDKIAAAINLVQTRDPAAEPKADEPPSKAETAPVVQPVAPQVAPERTFPKNWQEALVEFKTPLGMLIATLLILITMSGFKKIENQKVAVMAAGNQARAGAEPSSGDRAEDSNKTSTASAATGSVVASGSSSGESAFDQFKRISENYSDAAIYLVKTWVNMDSEASREALSALTKMVPVESLVPVVQTLSEDLKVRFKRASQTPVDAAAIQRAESFIVEQMVENFLVNAVDLPDDVKALMSGMSIQEAIECAKKDRRLGGIFVNVLQTGQVARLLRSLPEADVTAVFQEGLKYSPESIKYLGSALTGLLGQIRGGQKAAANPLIQRGIELIGTVGPEREGQVLQMLLTSGAKDQVVEATQRYYPAELLLTFPPDKLRVLIGRLSTRQRATLIYSRNEKDRKTLLGAIGDQGRVREMINEEIREIEKDEPLKAQIKKNQAKIWSDFVDASREAIRSDSRVKDVAEEILRKWLVAKGVDPSRLATLQAA